MNAVIEVNASSNLWRVLAACATLAGLLPVAGLRAQSITEVHVTPEMMKLSIGQEEPLLATAFDRQGNLVSAAQFTFRTSDSAVAVVRKDGMVIARKTGVAKVEARIGGRQASLTVLVEGGKTAGADPPPPTPGSASAANAASPGGVLALVPAALTLLPTEVTQLTPRLLRDDGISIAPQRVAWASLAPEIATVSDDGLVTAVAPGQTLAQAAAGGLTATVPVTVVQAEFALNTGRVALTLGRRDTLRAIVPSQRGRQLRAPLSWRSTDPAVAWIGADGVVQGVAPGTAEAVATGMGQERRARVLVYRRPETFVVSPRTSGGPLDLPLRGTATVSARAETAAATLVPEAPIEWEVGDSSLIAFDQKSGRLAGKALGTTTLTAKLEGFPAAVWKINVIPDSAADGRGVIQR